MATERLTDDQARKILDDGGWRPVQRLGGGGGGVVFRCLDRTVINALTPMLGASHGDPRIEKSIPEFLEVIGRTNFGAGKVSYLVDGRIKREIEALRRVPHPHLVHLLGHDPSVQPRWYVMEVLPHSLAGEGGVSVAYKGQFEEVFRRLLGLVQAVGALHTAEPSYVHRDIKPANIFVRESGEWVLGDLGIALANDGEDLTGSESLTPSRDWTPPWRIWPGQDHPPTWDLYMLANTALALCVGWKVKQQSWLNHADLNLPAKHPTQRGIHKIWQFFRSHLVVEEADFPSRDAAAFQRAIENVLDAMAPREASLLYSWHDPDSAGLSNGNANNEIIVYCSRPITRLIASAQTRSPSGQPGPTWYLERLDDKGDWKIVAPIEKAPLATKNGWETFYRIELGPPFEAGWNRLRLRFMDGVITGLMIYGE